ncbi:MAG: hypothetical protein RLZZ385_2158 [Pseudomonadota bacterium]|jgi:hypothetical protein
MKLGAAIVMALLGLYMLYIGWDAAIRAPTVTGIGFLVIASVYLADYLRANSRLPPS